MCYTALMAIGSMLRRRWLPEKSFPSYAYLPGRQPHPVRDPAGHSYNSQAMPLAAEISVDSDTFRWGLDLFNHGYYWEAHEAWERLWQVADRGAPLRMLFKGLILLSAAGVKIRESKQAAAMRHAGRAATLLRRLMNTADHSFVRALGMSPAALAEHAEAAARTRQPCRRHRSVSPKSCLNSFSDQAPAETRSVHKKDKQSSLEDARNRLVTDERMPRSIHLAVFSWCAEFRHVVFGTTKTQDGTARRRFRRLAADDYGARRVLELACGDT